MGMRIRQLSYIRAAGALVTFLQARAIGLSVEISSTQARANWR
jgi:hypothetical protein